jgi:dTDP-4-dehydrorhamnose reductase
MILVVGSQGMLGQGITKHLMDQGVCYVGASHSPGADIFIDLRRASNPLPWNSLSSLKYGVICSAISARRTCYDARNETYAFNVTHTLKLVDDLIEHDVVPVFVSSDAVFADRKRPYIETDDVAPQSVYGEHKAKVEQYLVNSGAPYLVVRLSKVFATNATDTSVFTQWREVFKSAKTVQAAHDQLITPTHVDDVASALWILMQGEHREIYHIAANQHMSRLDFAKALAEETGRFDWIQPCSIDDIDFVEPLAKSVLLDTAKLEHDTGYSARPFEEVWRDFLVREQCS